MDGVEIRIKIHQKKYVQFVTESCSSTKLSTTMDKYTRLVLTNIQHDIEKLLGEYTFTDVSSDVLERPLYRTAESLTTEERQRLYTILSLLDDFETAAA